MRFGWVEGAALAAALALAGCGGGGEPRDPGAEAAAFFLESNGRSEEVTTLPSGLQYRVVQSGPEGGASPDGNDLVRVNYEGALVDGTVFDSSFDRGAPYVTTPEQVIPGWTEALQLMSVGDEWIIYVPPELGYGAAGDPPTIPRNAVLIFRLQLLDVAKTPGGEVSARG